ncbi:hypothetical protein BD413DRAFT_489526 [Trametes elegans]|nr:hypothetical protein BD413DRAFT_489526 [Trametes elegans]
MSSTQNNAAAASSAQTSSQPAGAIHSTISALKDLRELTLENGRVIDLPITLLRDPAPKPVEFLHLQHYFEGGRGTAVDLSKCASADEAIDVLADEVEAMRLLLHGYVANFRRYVDRFEASQKQLREDIDGLAESYLGLMKIVKPACEAAKAVDQKFTALEKKLATVPVGRGVPPPPKIVRGPRLSALHNPPLSKAENAEARARQVKSRAQEREYNDVRVAEATLNDAAIVKEIMEPAPAPAPARREAAGESDPAASTELFVKIERLADGVAEARDELAKVQEATANNLVILRYREDESRMAARELWGRHDLTESFACAAGNISRAYAPRIDGYHKWADKAAAAATAADAADAEAAARDAAQDGAKDKVAAGNAPKDGANATAEPVKAPTLDGDLYAVTLDVSCEKPFEEMTREEAVAVLNSLPRRIYFVPYLGPPRDQDDDGADPETEAPPPPGETAAETEEGAAKAAGTACADAAEAVDAADTGKTIASTTCSAKAATDGHLNGSKASPRAHKRGRDGAEDEERVAVSDADPRPQSGGSPVKKRRQGKA